MRNLSIYLSIYVIQLIWEFFFNRSEIFFQTFFFHRCRFCIISKCLSEKSFESKKIFFLRLFKTIKVKHRSPGLNRCLLSNIWWLRSADHEKFTEKCVMSTEKFFFFNQKMFTNELTWLSHDEPVSKRSSME